MGTGVFLVKNHEKPRSKLKTKDPTKNIMFFSCFLSMISIPFHGFPLPTAACGAKAILRPPREQACVGDWESATSKKGKKHLSIKWKFLWEIRGLSFRARKIIEVNWRCSSKPCLMTRGYSATYKLGFDLGLGRWMQHTFPRCCSVLLMQFALGRS